MPSLFERRGSLTAPPAAPAPLRPKMSEIFGQTSRALPEGSVLTDAMRGRAVGESRDLERVVALPRRPKPTTEALEALRDKWTAKLGKPEGPCACKEHWGRPCAKRLNAVQAWALEEMHTVGGLLGPIGVGDGKTMLDLLAALAMGSKRAVLLIPPALKTQLLTVDWDYYGQHWRLPNRGDSRFFDPSLPMLHIVSYSELSGAKSTELLERLDPDLLIMDEAHNVRNRTAARTKRVFRYINAHPEVRVCSWSGTLTSKSLKDYAQLSNAALGDGSPTPQHWPTVEEWAGALDPGEFRAPIGRLSRLCEVGETAIEGYSRRLIETKGVVASLDGGNCNASLTFSQRLPSTPKEIQERYDELARSWERPDGEALVDALSVARCARELCAGFFNRWVWPRQESLEVRVKWLAARKEWHKEMREKLKQSRPHLDSPLLCYEAARRWYCGYVHVDEHGKRHEVGPKTKDGPKVVWSAAMWPEWEKLKDTCQPETEAVWVSDYLARDAAEWAKENTGIVWYEHPVFGLRVGELASVPVFGAGKRASEDIILERGMRTIVASIRSHGTGKNLQHAFCNNLVANPPSDGATWEQLIGRTHRQGQPEDEVTVTVYRHMPAMVEALDKARELAAHIEGTFRGAQKLVRATYLW